MAFPACIIGLNVNVNLSQAAVSRQLTPPP